MNLGLLVRVLVALWARQFYIQIEQIESLSYVWK